MDNEQRRRSEYRTRREERQARTEGARNAIPHPMPPEDMRVEDVRFFVVGHAKSGTTWLERTLDSHPEVLCRGAGLFFGKNRQALGGYRILHNVLLGCEGLREWHGQHAAQRTWTDARSFEEDAALMTRVVVDALMRRELTLSGKRILGDRTPDHLTQIKEIHDLYPNARIVHAVRDGRDVMVSAAHNRWRASRAPQTRMEFSDEEIEARDAYFEDRESFLAGGRSIFSGDWLRDMARRWS